MPSHVAPMMARLSALPRDEKPYAYEIKWDGIRVIAYVEAGKVRLESRNLIVITERYPELADLGRAIGKRRVVLDGEIVAFDEAGRPSFSRLQERMQLTSGADIRRKMPDVPVIYAIFDLLYNDGRNLMGEKYDARREQLEALNLSGEHWQVPSNFLGRGAQFLQASRARNLEGIVAKRRDSVYEAGRRSGAWLKIKSQLRQELVIAGWIPGEGRREGRIGSLLVGYYDISREEAQRRGRPQRLVYAGKAGTGFTDKTLDELMKLLVPLRRKATPFEEGAPPRIAIFAEPNLVGEFEFTEWTHLGSARHPSFKGLRNDKDPRDVVKEVVARTGGE